MSNNTKRVINFTLDRKLDDYMNELFGNKSRYVEYLILEDLKKVIGSEELKKLLKGG